MKYQRGASFKLFSLFASTTIKMESQVLFCVLLPLFFLSFFIASEAMATIANYCNCIEWKVSSNGKSGVWYDLNRLESLSLKKGIFVSAEQVVFLCVLNTNAQTHTHYMVSTLCSHNHEKCMNQSNTLNKHINKILNIYRKYMYNKYFVRQMTLLHRSHCIPTKEGEFLFVFVSVSIFSAGLSVACSF